MLTCLHITHSCLHPGNSHNKDPIVFKAEKFYFLTLYGKSVPTAALDRLFSTRLKSDQIPNHLLITPHSRTWVINAQCQRTPQNEESSSSE